MRIPGVERIQQARFRGCYQGRHPTKMAEVRTSLTNFMVLRANFMVLLRANFMVLRGKQEAHCSKKRRVESLVYVPLLNTCYISI